MGYSEVHCQLCGVAFNIGRVRRAGEPLNAAFSYGEQNELSYNFVTKEVIQRQECPPDSGCSNVKTTKRKEQHFAKADTWLVQNGNDDDSDWDYKSEEDDEILEWIENDESLETSDSKTEEGSGFEPWDFDDDSNQQLIEAGPSRLSISSAVPDSPEGSDNDNDDTFLVKYRRCQSLEHLAGAGCSHLRGYNGNNITAEEMFGSCTVQCLVRKDALWQAESNDEEFEVYGNYFLSGLGGHMPSRDIGGLKAIPTRHKLEEEFYPDDEIEPGEGVPMPFHPSCFEIYRRVSQLRFGSFKVGCLYQWRLLEVGDGSRTERINDSDPAVQRALHDGQHSHIPGDEWLAANPLFVPALPGILENAVCENAESFDVRNSAFPTCRAGARSNARIAELEDCFHILPQEVLLLIVETIRSPDIAALRLASRAFTHLPILLWKKLLRREMPWLWEVWSHDQPYKWAAVSVIDIEAEGKRIREVAAELRDLQRLHRNVIQEEMPEHWTQYCIDHPWVTEDVDEEERIALQQMIPRLGLSRSICSLPQDRTNWYEVYRLITKHWDQLKGLRNRQRIWNVCETISDIIEKYTEEGKISV